MEGFTHVGIETKAIATDETRHPEEHIVSDEKPSF
jgi:hypothetical protein